MKLITPSSYILIIALFFFSFCDFNCSGTKLLELKGIEMVTGKDAMKKNQGVQSEGDLFDQDLSLQKDIDPILWADISFGMAIIGLSVFLVMASVGRLGTGRVVYLVTSAIGAISQFAIKIHIDSKVDDQEAFKLVTVDYTPAFWLVIGLFVLTLVINLLPGYKLVKQAATPSLPENKDYLQNLGNIE